MYAHSKPSITLNIYAHCVSESQFEATGIMEEITTPIAIDLNDIPQNIINNLLSWLHQRCTKNSQP